ncbi:hypothetical protein DAEQUDRAFT_494380 [Daedalea quercina L-15889]|uniref:Uncharacterized protein n=1 Tax=Daedalea quercina L-15889 TaxID=1314783 RepID=A0A165MN45_9APHY|nr:hypothetical protein DAEQUDRAFT_494380 [Daedalea quercina L-15889]
MMLAGGFPLKPSVRAFSMQFISETLSASMQFIHSISLSAPCTSNQSGGESAHRRRADTRNEPGDDDSISGIQQAARLGGTAWIPSPTRLTCGHKTVGIRYRALLSSRIDSSHRVGSPRARLLLTHPFQDRADLPLPILAQEPADRLNSQTSNWVPVGCHSLLCAAPPSLSLPRAALCHRCCRAAEHGPLCLGYADARLR